ncbi:hypothetical protein CYMTET_13271 [Cymbomonas tetramitiformis]|uniref:Calcineurin-like phosphoesterase domain-containing protein n=1 Tax=Cymbomonas tetramitiformis TaxID=36881 RepID=A0AAE0GIU8_9CHLO|nr:hypothetical protein CYMTET_13271 [Cymbomonas tetramitiformis]
MICARGPGALAIESAVAFVVLLLVWLNHSLLKTHVVIPALASAGGNAPSPTIEAPTSTRKLPMAPLRVTSASPVPAEAAASTSASAPFRFFSIGDQGTGGKPQHSVAAAMQKLSSERNPALILGLGDNFYMSGVRNIRDPQWMQKYEQLYNRGPLKNVPFYPAIGDHDHCQNVSALVDYTYNSPSQPTNWRLPARYHTMRHDIPSGGHVEFIITDSVGLEGAFTNITRPDGQPDRRFAPNLSPQFTDEAAGKLQLEWLENTLEQPLLPGSWRIVIGHRPVLSGSHRFKNDARQYPAEERFRAHLRELLAKHKVDAYLDGHDHTTQWMCAEGVSYLVNGVGGYDLHALDKRHPLTETIWQNNTFHGFAIHQMTMERMQIEYFDMEGALRHTLSIPKFGGCIQDLQEAQNLSQAEITSM